MQIPLSPAPHHFNIMAKQKVTILYNELFYSNAYLDLSNNAKVVYGYLKAGFNGFNQNKIELPYGSMKRVVSNKTFFRVINELIDKGWIIKIGNGGLMQNRNKYGLTFKYDKFQVSQKKNKKKT